MPKGTVDVPTTSPLGPSELTVPAIVMAGASALRVVPATITPFERIVKGWPAMAMMLEAEEPRGCVASQ